MVDSKGIVYQVVSWPLGVVADVQAGAVVPAALGVAAPVLLMGVPSLDSPAADLAVWYLAAGGMFYVVQNIFMPAPYQGPGAHY